MPYVFYDIETTGTNSYFDQMLQFAALKTDDDLNVIDSFDTRCRLLPHIIPSPRALCITQVSPSMLTDTALPSHYEMITRIRNKLIEWSPATFIGFNSLNFDEHFLRQALFQNLYPPYLTNTNGNNRFDALRLAYAVHAYAPDTIKVPISREGRQVFQLAGLAKINDYKQYKAHEAMADVLATVHLTRLMRTGGPAVWDAMNRATTKKAVRNYVSKESIFTLTEPHFGRTYSWLVTFCGQNPERDGNLAVFDLAFDPHDYLSLAVPDLIELLNANPRPIRSLSANQQPIMMPENVAPTGTRALDISHRERRRRRGLIQACPEFLDRVGQALAHRFEREESSPYPERQIYDGFSGRSDKERMLDFHRVQWNRRVDLAAQFDDPRLVKFAHRLISIERPEVLPTKTTKQFRTWIAKRILCEDESVPWMTVSKALRDIDGLLKDAGGTDEALLRDIMTFVHRVGDSFVQD